MSRFENLLADFQFFDNWEDRYEYIIDLGRALPPMASALKTENTEVKGCMSKVWMVVYNKEEKLYFQADSDALIVKGLIAIVKRLFDGASKQEIACTDVKEVFQKLQLDTNLASTRRNGLAKIIETIQKSAKK